MTWKAFEELIAVIQRQTALTAEVRHNHKIRGRTGRLRQLDVTLSTRVGLHEVLIAVECKRYKRPVGIEKVEAFASKLRDVNASQGVMVSPTGFDAGARAAAQEFNIGLWTYHEAAEVDWQELMGPSSWVTFTISTLEDVCGIVRTKRPRNVRPADTTILNERGEKLFALTEVNEAEGEKLLLKAPGTYRASA